MEPCHAFLSSLSLHFASVANIPSLAARYTPLPPPPPEFNSVLPARLEALFARAFTTAPPATARKMEAIKSFFLQSRHQLLTLIGEQAHQRIEHIRSAAQVSQQRIDESLLLKALNEEYETRLKWLEDSVASVVQQSISRIKVADNVNRSSYITRRKKRDMRHGNVAFDSPKVSHRNSAFDIAAANMPLASVGIMPPSSPPLSDETMSGAVNQMSFSSASDETFLSQSMEDFSLDSLFPGIESVLNSTPTSYTEYSTPTPTTAATAATGTATSDNIEVFQQLLQLVNDTNTVTDPLSGFQISGFDSGAELESSSYEAESVNALARLIEAWYSSNNSNNISSDSNGNNSNSDDTKVEQEAATDQGNVPELQAGLSFSSEDAQDGQDLFQKYINFG